MTDLAELFWPKVDASGDCWEWTLSRDRDGYGQMVRSGTRYLVHRLAWSLLVGPIPEGMQIDHLCKVRHCVNPDHMEVVTPTENHHRSAVRYINGNKTHCKWGHEFDEVNTYRWRKRRYCRACARALAQRRIEE